MDAGLEQATAIVALVAAGCWLALVAWSTASLARARTAGDAPRVVDRAASVARVATLAAAPLAVIAGVAGVTYVAEGAASLDSDWWVGTAIGTWLVCFFGSTLLRGRHLTHAVRLSSEHGVEDEDVQWRIRRVDLLGRGELLLLVVALLVVALQPGPNAFG
jgi:hypothetical protein